MTKEKEEQKKIADNIVKNTVKKEIIKSDLKKEEHQLTKKEEHQLTKVDAPIVEEVTHVVEKHEPKHDAKRVDHRPEAKDKDDPEKFPFANMASCFE